MKDKNIIKKNKSLRRVARVRAKITGRGDRPRLAVHRSLKHVSVQAIDDTVNKTIATATDKEVKGKTKTEKGLAVGGLISKKLLEKNISQAVFDKRHYRYHGVVKAVAEGARKGGLRI